MSKKQPKKGAQPQPETATSKFTAVILADTFTHDFKPISYTIPRALIPLVNVAMLDYTLEFLTSNGFEEIFIFCCAHSKSIREHINQSRWVNCEASIKVLVSQCTTPGDALRSINDYDVIRQDFVLVPGDLVTNFSKLKEVLGRHRARREKDPSILMTLVLKEQPAISSQAERTGGVTLAEERVTAVIDSASGHLLYYKPWFSTRFGAGDQTAADHEVVLDEKLFKDRSVIQCRSDLIDTNIVVCAPELLGLFKENFDFFDIKHDCVKDILEEELRGSKVAVDIIRVPFLERVCSFTHYAAVSQAVLNRWLYPIVPEHNFAALRKKLPSLSSSNTSSSSSSPAAAVESRPTHGFSVNHVRSVYISTAAKLSHGVSATVGVLVGYKTAVAEGAVLTSCVVGSRCVIGRNVKIVNSYIFDNVIIGDNCVLEGCIVCEKVNIGKGARICTGSVLCVEVKIGEGITIPADSRIYVKGALDAECGEGGGAQSRTTSPAKTNVPVSPINDLDVVGRDGRGRLWCPSEVEQSVLDVFVPRMDEDEVSESESDDEDGFGGGGGHRSQQPQQPIRGTEDAVRQDLIKFLDEVKGTLHRAIAENHQLDNCILEINGLKFAYDRPFQDCVKGVLKGLFSYVDPKKTPKEFREEITALLTKKWKEVVKKFMITEAVEMEALQCMAEITVECKLLEGTFVHILKLFYDLDLLSEATILNWSSAIEKSGSARDRALLQKSEKFIEWLREAEEEESSDG